MKCQALFSQKYFKMSSVIGTLRINCVYLLTSKGPITTAAGDNFDDSHEISRLIFSEKKKKIRLLFSTNFACWLKG